MIERETHRNGFIQRFGGPIALAVALFFVATGLWDRTYDWMVGGAVREHNADYLNASAKKAATLLVPIAAARGAVDVVEGSEMVVEFGDLVQPILDYLNLTWKVVLGASIAMVMTKQLLDGTADLGPLFFCASIALFLLLALFPARHRAKHVGAELVRRLAAMSLLVALLFYIVFPVSIWASSWLSQHSTANITQEYESTFDQLAETFSMKEVTEAEGLKDKAEGFKARAEALVKYVESGGARDLGKSVIYVTVAYTLDGIVFPVLTLLFLIWFIRGALYPVLGLQTNKADH